MAFNEYGMSKKYWHTYLEVVTLLEETKLGSNEGRDEFELAEDISVAFFDPDLSPPFGSLEVIDVLRSQFDASVPGSPDMS